MLFYDKLAHTGHSKIVRDIIAKTSSRSDKHNSEKRLGPETLSIAMHGVGVVRVVGPNVFFETKNVP